MDFDVLSALSEREAYERYARFIKRSSLNQQAYTIFEAMGTWLQNNPTKARVDWRGFAAWFLLVRHAKLKEDQQAVYKGLLESMVDRQAGEDLDSLMEGLAKRDYGAQIAELALRMADGDHGVTMTHIAEKLEEYREATGKLDALDKDIGEFSIADLDSATTGGYNWRMKALRASLGPVRRGDLIVLATRPDTGKTTFLASEGTFMGEQMEQEDCILWLNNEEQGSKVRRRIVQAAIGWTSAEMNDDPAGAMAEYSATVGHPQRIIVFDRAKIHTKDVEALCKKHRPKLIIFDQLRKVHGFDNEDEVSRQELLYNWARELAKEWAPVINVTQLGAGGAEKKYIGMEEIFGAKTGPQGEADAIITMGRLSSEGNQRYIYVPKNKLLTPGDPTKRNGKWEVTIDPDRAGFTGVHA